MISWIKVAPLFTLPMFVIFLIGLIPQFELFGHVVGGGLIRQILINHFLLPVLPNTDAVVITQWYMSTTLFNELLLHALIAININALLLPFLYLLGLGYIRFNNWAAKTDLDLKRSSAKR